MNEVFIIISLSQLTNLIIDSSLSMKLKQYFRIDRFDLLNELLNCPECLGFWIGCISILFGFPWYFVLVVSLTSKIIYKI